MNPPEAVRWTEDGAAVDLLDQTRLPEAEVRLRLASAADLAEAIRSLRVRGAPAIGIAAAMGVAVEAARLAAGRAAGTRADAGGAGPGATAEPSAEAVAASFRAGVEAAIDALAATRPTAANLFGALGRMRARLAAESGRAPAAVARALRDEADAIRAEDREMCRRIGEHGLAVLPAGDAAVLTHCNAGALATGGIGTALAPVYVAHARGRAVRVYVGETRPVLQGSRLTAWELNRAGVPVTVVADTVAGWLLAQGRIGLVLTGADRIAANGDVANKIGTYALAVLARHHGVPFYVAAPTTTLDPAVPHGAAIPIEERDPDEVRRGFGRRTTPAEVPVYAPAFDVTPAAYVAGIITERGILRPPYGASIERALGAAAAAG